MPFQTPQAPSVCQSTDRAAVKEDGDLRSSVCGDGRGAAEGGGDDVASEVVPQSGEPRLLRARD